jgi:hypothetical protein
MNPAFPDIVGEWARNSEPESSPCANDNGEEDANDLSDPLLTLFARLDIAANRLW